MEGIDHEIQSGGLTVPERMILAPSTVSPQAQAFLSFPPDMMQEPSPPPDDKQAWRAHIAAGNARLTQMLAVSVAEIDAQITVHQVGPVKVYEVASESALEAPPDRAILYLHGGAFIHGSGVAAAYMAMPLASIAGVRTFSVDYRMPPDHSLPAGLDDCVAAYQWLLGSFSPHTIVVAGGSAGGGLAASMVLKVRDLGLPLPGACVLATPEADLTESGDTFETNHTIDVVLKHRLTDTITLYAGGHDLRDPYLSAVFGDFTKGYPPTLLTSGTRDIFLSNTVLLHRALRRAGIEAELHVWEAMPHGGFFGAPEDREVLEEQACFIRKKLRID